MGLSIQDYLKKINSWLTFPDILSIFITFFFVALFTGYILRTQQENAHNVIYKVGLEESVLTSESETQPDLRDVRPFGSINGKTYTFGWCQGATRITPKNKIYFGSEEEAKGVGRTLSKLCKR